MKISTGGEVQVTKILIVRTTKMDDDGGGRDEANDDVSFLHCRVRQRVEPVLRHSFVS